MLKQYRKKRPVKKVKKRTARDFIDDLDKSLARINKSYDIYVTQYANCKSKILIDHMDQLVEMNYLVNHWNLAEQKITLDLSTKPYGAFSPPKPDYLVARNKTLITKQDRDITDYAPGIKVVPSDLKERIFTLAEYANSAMEKSYAPITGKRIGASVLTENGHIYTGSIVESQISGSTICAERAAIIKAVTEGDFTFDSLVIYGDSKDDFPYPCGSCRQFMAEYGDFYVALMKADSSLRIYRASSLLPNPSKPVRSTVYKTTLDEIADEIQKSRSKGSDNVMYWNTRDVGDWLEKHNFQRYIECFEREHITGEKLIELTEKDLKYIGVENAHIPEMLSILRDLVENNLREYGYENKQIKEYVELLDRDRIRTIARLKRVFDIYDLDRDGFINRVEVQCVLERLHNTSNENVAKWLRENARKNDLISFEDFVECYVNLASGRIPPEPHQKKINDIRLYDDDDDIEYILRKYNRRDNTSVPLNTIRILKDNFTKLDINKDNRINIDEVSQIFDRIGNPLDKETLEVFMKGRGLITMEYISFIDVLEAYISLVMNRTLRESVEFKRIPDETNPSYIFIKSTRKELLPFDGYKNNNNRSSMTKSLSESKTMDPDVKKAEQESKREDIKNQTKREDFFSGTSSKSGGGGGESKTDTLQDDEMFDDFDKSDSFKVSFNIGDHVIHRGKKAVIERKKAAETWQIRYEDGDTATVKSDSLKKDEIKKSFTSEDMKQNTK